MWQHIREQFFHLLPAFWIIEISYILHGSGQFFLGAFIEGDGVFHHGHIKDYASDAFFETDPFLLSCWGRFQARLPFDFVGLQGIQKKSILKRIDSARGDIGNLEKN